MKKSNTPSDGKTVVARMLAETYDQHTLAEAARLAPQVRNLSPGLDIEAQVNAAARGRSLSIADVAAELGVSYHTARRLLLSVGVARYSTTSTGDAIYPGTPLKRFQRTRMTYVATREDVVKIRALMAGERA